MIWSAGEKPGQGGGPSDAAGSPALRLAVSVWIGGIILAVAVWAAALALSDREGKEAMERARRDTANLTRSIAEQTVRAISGADQILAFLAFDLGRFGFNNPDLGAVLRNAVEGSELLLQLAYTDEKGDLVQTSVDGPPPRVNLADREHFRVHKEGRVQGLFISRPVYGRASGKWSIQLSRRIDGPDGRFAGMIVISLDPFYFSRTFDDLEVGRRGVVTILGRDGILRARSVMDETIIGQDLSGSPVFAAATAAPEGFQRSVSTIDGVTRLLGFREVPGYPLIVLAGFEEAEFLADVRARRQTYLSGAGAVSGLLLVVALLVSWQARRQARVAAALAETAERLSGSEQRLRDIVETASDWFWEMGPDLRFTGYSGGPQGPSGIGDRIVGRRRDEVALREPGDEEHWRRHQETLDRHEPFRGFEYAVETPEGERRIWSVSGTPVFDPQGQFQGYRGSGSDITDRRRAERALAASERRYRAMFKAVGQPIIVTDAEGTVVGFNPAAERLFGWSEVEVCGNNIAMLMPEPYAAEHPGYYRAYRRSGRKTPVGTLRELTARCADGTLLPVEIALSNWRSGGDEFFIGIVRDISASKQIEAELRRARDSAEHASRMKSEFLATISHEIRTPMNGVLGTVTLLGAEPLEPEQKRLADIARQSAEGLLGLLDDILDFSKLEAGRVTVETATVSPAALLEAVVQVLRPRAEEKGLRLSWRLLPRTPDAVVTDGARLRQILFNLIGNAIKFTEAGHVAIRGRRGRDLEDGRFLLDFEVEDTGIGINPEVLPSLFDRFTQADGSITRRFGGTGLGLAICRELCLLLGGDITVDSAPGRGSVFRFTIACGEGDPALLRTEETEAAAGTHALPPMRVLAVDDNAINRDIVRMLLERSGHTVVTAADGEEAVRLAASGGFDLILMDIQMPVLDGMAATRRIRALPPPAGLVPVIALTAQASGTARPDCAAAGMDGYVPKPVRPAVLFAEMTSVMEATRSRVHLPSSGRLAGLLDEEQVRMLEGALGPARWGETVRFLEVAAQEQVDALIRALDAGEDHRLPAHTLKGVAWNAGAARLGDFALTIETAEPAEARRLAAGLGDLLRATIDALREREPA
ncbi:PAS domain S-box protein [Azospirillum thermophilum]|uniref:histidine kinase n=1 Tax=Azospirillum thermophilum TaxID=2202148 RepID=A0A2S2CYB8_9PROT|nr:PAS domain S-box protein [Azospirillum thermophilum]AWK89486.1 hybrid sensor histidine kinase/response regulator [Azospirillum thermophilum]